jgi:hypothetical protein
MVAMTTGTGIMVLTVILADANLGVPGKSKRRNYGANRTTNPLFQWNFCCDFFYNFHNIHFFVQF